VSDGQRRGPHPEVDALLASLREQVAHRGPGPRVELRPPGGPPTASSGDDLGTVRRALRLGVLVQHVGLRRPEFARFGPIRRRLATLAAQPLLYALQIVTRDQRAFNGALLDAMAELTDVLERRLDSIEARLAALEGRAGSSGAEGEASSAVSDAGAEPSPQPPGGSRGRPLAPAARAGSEPEDASS